MTQTIIQILFIANLLAFTLPISFRLAVIFGNWLDGKFEDLERNR